MKKPRTTHTEDAAPPILIRHRTTLTSLANVAVIVASWCTAFLLRFDMALPPAERDRMLATLPVAVVVAYATMRWFKLTRGWWRYVGTVDLVNAAKAALAATILLATYIFFFHRVGFPRSVFFLNALLLVGLSIGIRIGVRLWRQTTFITSEHRRLLIIGAGDTGEALLREIRHGEKLRHYQVVAFLDDDPAKQGAYINGVRVLAPVSAAPQLVRQFRIDELIVATPSASGQEMRRIIEICRQSELPFKVMPATWDVLHGKPTLAAAREVDIHDLLRRPPVALDLQSIGQFLEGKCVLVTGAAGSIGSEICAQILRFKPAELLCVDHDENALFFLERQLQPGTSAIKMSFVLADVTDATRIAHIFEAKRPAIVYHAAAHKHVPIVEANPVEGLRNNVFGTMVVASAAHQYGAERFVLISTDKAVNPTSVMGASKRIAELLLHSFESRTRFCAVRFGNVLGSQGSVVPIFKAQIAAGGPITITDPAMERYFMTIPEAVELVIQASAMGRGGELFMLEMGEPVRIVDLAKDLIRLSGLRENVDIAIQYSGIRPGEKLREELYFDHEKSDRTDHPKIMLARQQVPERERLRAMLDELRRAVDSGDDALARRLIPRIVPEFRGHYGQVVELPVDKVRPAAGA